MYSIFGGVFGLLINEGEISTSLFFCTFFTSLAAVAADTNYTVLPLLFHNQGTEKHVNLHHLLISQILK